MPNFDIDAYDSFAAARRNASLIAGTPDIAPMGLTTDVPAIPQYLRGVKTGYLGQAAEGESALAKTLTQPWTQAMLGGGKTMKGLTSATAAVLRNQSANVAPPPEDVAAAEATMPGRIGSATGKVGAMLAEQAPMLAMGGGLIAGATGIVGKALASAGVMGSAGAMSGGLRGGLPGAAVGGAQGAIFGGLGVLPWWAQVGAGAALGGGAAAMGGAKPERVAEEAAFSGAFPAAAHGLTKLAGKLPVSPKMDWLSWLSGKAGMGHPLRPLLEGGDVGNNVLTAAMRYRGAAGEAAAQGEELFAAAKKILPDEAQQKLAAKWMNDVASRALDAKRATAGETGQPNNIPKLSPEEAATIKADPALQKFIAWYRKARMPYEQMGPQAGIKTDLSTPEGDYAPAVPMNEGPLPAIGAGEASFAKAKRSMSAKARTGASDEYFEDLQKSLAALASRVKPAQQNELYAAVRAAAVPDATGPDTPPLPTVKLRGGQEVEAVQWGKRLVPLANVDLPDPANPTQAERLRVPQPVKDAYDRAILPSDNEGWFQSLRNQQTQVAVSGYPEAVRHGMTLAGIASNMRGAGAGSTNLMAQQLESLQPSQWTAAQLLNSRNELRSMGALRSINIGHENAVSNVIMAAQPGSYAVRGAVFGDMGLEQMARASTNLWLKEQFPEMSAGQRALVVQNKYGSSDAATRPWLARAGAQMFDPFASIFVAAGKNGVKSMLGVNDANQFDPQVFTRNWSSFMSAWYLWNKAADPDHRDPWKIPGLAFNKFLVPGATSKQQPATVGIDVVFPGLSRGLGYTGARQGIEQGIQEGDRWGRNPEVATERTLAASGRGIAQTALTRVAGSVFTKPIATAITGNEPIYKRDMEQVPSPVQSESHPVLAGAQRMAENITPMTEALTEGGGSARPLSLGAGVIQTLGKTVGISVNLGPPEDLQKQFAKTRPYTEANAMVDKMVANWRRQSSDKGEQAKSAQEFIYGPAFEDVPQDVRMAAYRHALLSIYGQSVRRYMR